MGSVNDTDREWKRWGRRDPYYAVLSHPKYREGRNPEDFFATGEREFSDMRAGFERFSIPLDPHRAALDYGCGVGRLLKPMEAYFERCVGIDVSEAMLREAARHVDSGHTDLRLFDGRNLPACLGDEAFGFIHTRIVLQHIRPARGFMLVKQLLSRLDINGCAFIQAPMRAKSRLVYLLNQVRFFHPALYKISQALLAKKGAFADPVMQMNVYPAEAMLALYDEMDIEVRGVMLDTTRNLTAAAWFLHRPVSPAG